MKMISHMAIMLCVAGFLAAGHSLLKPKFPILLKGDVVAPTAVEPTAAPAQATESDASKAEAPAQSPVAAPKSAIDITIAQSHVYFEQGKPFIDARHLDEYMAGHVPNAYQLSADELLQGKGQMWLGALDKNDVIVIYCGGGACDASHNLYNYLTKSFGFTKCLIMTDGLPGWTAAGHSIDTGAPAIGNEP